MIGSAVLALALAQGGVPDAALRRRLDAFFALPSLSPHRTKYRRAMEAGQVKVAAGENGGTRVWYGAVDRFGLGATRLEFDASGAVIEFQNPLEGDLGYYTDRRMPDPKVAQAVQRAVREITGETRIIERRYGMRRVDGVPFAEYFAYRVLDGRPVIAALYTIDTFGVKGELRSFYVSTQEEPVDAETHGSEKTLPLKRLRAIAGETMRGWKERLKATKARFEVEKDWIIVAVPSGRAKEDREFYDRRFAIPMYHRVEHAAKGPKGDLTLEVYLDARDGRVVSTMAGAGRL